MYWELYPVETHMLEKLQLGDPNNLSIGNPTIGYNVVWELEFEAHRIWPVIIPKYGVKL